MGQILLRAGKDPFTPVSGETTLQQRLNNSNTGNYLFMHSVHKTLMTATTTVVPNGTLSETRTATARDIAQVNEQFDAFVIPLANAFRPEFEHRLSNLTSLVERLTIPVVVVGVGAQAGLHEDMPSAGLDKTVVSFMTAVLDRSASVGVRGGFTRDYLARLGFGDEHVDVIGCPSVFLHGADFQLLPTVGSLGEDARIALNVTNGVPGLGDLVSGLHARHPGLVFIGQDKRDLRVVLWGEDPSPDKDIDLSLPLHHAHPLYVEDKVRFPLETWSWLDYLREFDFATGTRLHGNLAALLAGTPAVLLVHDSRTAELAAYHGLPSRTAEGLSPSLTAQELWDSYDPAPFNAAYDERFRTYLTFLERNGLEHVYTPGNESDEFAARVAATTFAPPLAPLSSLRPEDIASRLRWLRDGISLDSSQHRQAYRTPFTHPASRDQSPGPRVQRDRLRRKLLATEKHLANTERELATVRESHQAVTSALRKRLDRQAHRLSTLESAAQRTLGARLLRAAKHAAKRVLARDAV
jgi:hypothetical protein